MMVHEDPAPEHHETGTILVVEDESGSRLLLQTTLASVGYQVLMAKNGVNALQILNAHIPDLILMEVTLPDVRGYEICKKLKSTSAFEFIPVILVTALIGEAERSEAMICGADDFIAKPFQRLELLTRVKSLIRIKRLHEHLEQKVQELEQARTALQQLAVTDGLTGLHNYRFFRWQLEREILRSKRYNHPVSLAMLDIDHFKKINDRWGHLIGDQILRQLSDLVVQKVRGTDLVARYGGEEFAVILPDTDKTGAYRVAEKIRRTVEQHSWTLPNQELLNRMTVSLGIGTYPLDAKDLDSLIEKTDQALYRAKRGGRNQVVEA